MKKLQYKDEAIQVLLTSQMANYLKLIAKPEFRNRKTGLIDSVFRMIRFCLVSTKRCFYAEYWDDFLAKRDTVDLFIYTAHYSNQPPLSTKLMRFLVNAMNTHQVNRLRNILTSRITMMKGSQVCSVFEGLPHYLRIASHTHTHTPDAWPLYVKNALEFLPELNSPKSLWDLVCRAVARSLSSRGLHDIKALHLPRIIVRYVFQNDQ